ncbi:heat shock 70 kDa protein 12B-like isoform X1 [Mya arenaria]|uniref:heat shock 70 kDa protein 12B-like isoform X1 n=1 Tax=Mya arenaria TaxID=6604 RepID=UPI0022E89840|nr:heat shock 70 kDa protein 12B-like isoform X1 [Mya arenaria]
MGGHSSKSFTSIDEIAAAKAQSHLLVAAFEFGTTYSGYAFSFRNDPLKVQTNQNWYGGAGKLISLKTPTSVLLNPKGEFDSFGFEAEDRYAYKAEDDEHKGWRLFRRFMMVLHNNKELSRATTVEDIEGKSHQALPIFSLAIKFLHKHLLQAVANQTVGVLETDISYVITVPAIWDDNANKFMRMAVEEAGLDETRVALALEPEAASIWCETLDVDTKAALAGTGTQYMVIDLGGGTAVISFREKKGTGTLKEIHQPTGGPWGGIYVDANYLKFLEHIFGEKAITALKTEERADFFDVIREFETKKRTFSKNTTGKITFRISSNIRKLSKKFTGQNLEQRICSLGFGESVIVKGDDKLRVESDIVRTWFDGPIDSLIGQIKSLLKKRKLRAVQTIVLVGGFGGSPYVHDRLRAAFPDKRLILSADAELAVLKGAVKFGYNPLVVVEKEKKYSTLLVAAFDFGTTYSGYAFSFMNDPLKVQTNQTWSSRATGRLISLKTSTSVLLNPEGEFDSFGFEAEDSYASKAEDDQHEGWRLFRRFKMVLQNKVLLRDTTVEDIEGNSHEALPIFAMAIKFLHEHLLKAVENQTDILLEEEISYVITVPAIWDDNAKELMRTAAEEAGLDGTRVTLALEPEAASIWCETLDVDTRAALAGAGTQYMVIDLGGGTADISIHEKNQDGTLKEIHQPTGGPWGGIYVDANYLKFLENIFGENAITALKTEDMADYFDVIRDFETKKITLNKKMTGKFTFKISSTAKKLSKELTGQNLEQRLDSLGYGESVVVKGDKLRVEPDIIRSWFDGPIDDIIGHVKSLLKEPKLRAVQTIVLVGGFGESTYVQERLRADIPDKRLIVPAEAGLAVLKGAVRFGHNPTIITSRVMKYTYGVEVKMIYDEKIHSDDKKYFDEDGKWRVFKCFDVFVRVNKDVPIDHKITKGYIPLAYRTSIAIFRTTTENPVYVTDPGCELLGKLILELPRDMPLSELNTDITFIFGGTELVVKGRVRKTGEEQILKLNCLK